MSPARRRPIGGIPRRETVDNAPRMPDDALMSTPDALVIRSARLSEIFDLRHDVLRTGRPPETARFDGDNDPATRHVGVFAGGRCVACATVMAHPWEGRPAWHLRGIAVAADRQRQGLGSRLLAFLERDLPSVPGAPRLFWCNARETAVPFYLRHGWTVASEPFDLPGVGPHRRMWKRL